MTQYWISRVLSKSSATISKEGKGAAFVIMSGSQDLALLAFMSLVFVFIIYVVSPQLLLGLMGGIGAWHASKMRDIEAENSGLRMRKVKVYIKRMHKGQYPALIQGGGT